MKRRFTTALRSSSFPPNTEPAWFTVVFWVRRDCVTKVLHTITCMGIRVEGLEPLHPVYHHNLNRPCWVNAYGNNGSELGHTTILFFYATENDDSANDDIVADRHLVK